MQSLINNTLYLQFGAAVEMLSNAIQACPTNEWDTQEQFWYKAYHTLFYTDYYLSEAPDDFMPPHPFSLSEMDPSGKMPERVYTQNELLFYADFCKQKAKHLITGLNENTMQMRFVNANRNYSRLEIILYNMRHIQHHTGQLNMQLRQANIDAPKWVSQAL